MRPGRNPQSEIAALLADVHLPKQQNEATPEQAKKTDRTRRKA